MIHAFKTPQAQIAIALVASIALVALALTSDLPVAIVPALIVPFWIPIFARHQAPPSPQARRLMLASVALGILSFAVGTRVEAHQRDVNDQAFDVSLHIVFETQAQHDAYQSAPEHLRFIEACSDNWKAVRVHDSFARELRGGLGE